MSFSPSSSKDDVPMGSFLWEIEPEAAQPNRACWTKSINTKETLARQIPGLRIKAGTKRVFLFGHNRLNEEAAQRMADVLNGGPGGIAFADYAQAGQLNFWPGKCGPPR